MDKRTSLLLLAWIRKHLHQCENPRAHGKSLEGTLKEKWRYRIGDYRLIAKISDETITLLILNIGHRKDIYKEK